MKQNVDNAGTWENFLTGYSKGGAAGIKAAIEQTRRGAKNDFDLAMQNLQGVAGEAAPIVQPVLTDYQTSFDKASGVATKTAQTREQKIEELKKLRQGK